MCCLFKIRNPVITSLLNRADYIEQIGTEINRIKSAVKEHGQGNVEFYYDNFFTVTFTRAKKGSSPIQKGPCPHQKQF